MINLNEKFDLHHPSVLLHAPCGCVFESTVKIRDGVIECPWCGATTLVEEFTAWVNGDSPLPIFLCNWPKELIRCREGHLHEVRGEHMGMPVIQVGQNLVRVSDFQLVQN